MITVKTSISDFAYSILPPNTEGLDAVRLPPTPLPQTKRNYDSCSKCVQYIAQLKTIQIPLGMPTVWPSKLKCKSSTHCGESKETTCKWSWHGGIRVLYIFKPRSELWELLNAWTNFHESTNYFWKFGNRLPSTLKAKRNIWDGGLTCLVSLKTSLVLISFEVSLSATVQHFPLGRMEEFP